MPEVLEQPTIQPAQPIGRIPNASADIRPQRRDYQPPQNSRPMGVSAADEKRFAPDLDAREPKSEHPVQPSKPAPAPPAQAPKPAAGAADLAGVDLGTAQQATGAAAKLATGNGSAEEAVQAAEAVGGSLFINFMWYSFLEVFPGWLWAIPVLDIYIFIGMIKKDSPAFQQLSTTKKWIVIGANLLVIIVVGVILLVIAKAYCDSLPGLAYKAATAVTGKPDYCQAVSSIFSPSK